MKFNSLLILSLFFLASCEAFKTKESIDPLFEAKKLSESYPSNVSLLESADHDLGMASDNLVRFTFKIPLSQDMIGYYDYSSIMDSKAIPKRKSTIVKRFLRNVKHRFYNTGIGIGVMNKVRFSTDYEFPDMDYDFIKELKIKNIFFSLDKCDHLDDGCIDFEKKDKVSINLLNSFFVNLSTIEPYDNMDFVEDPLSFLSSKEYQGYEQLAQNPVPLFASREYRYEYGDDAALFKNITVARISKKEIDSVRKMKNKNDHKVLKFKSRNKYVQVKRLFEREVFSNVVKDVSLVGRNIYVELYDSKLDQELFKIVGKENINLEKEGVDLFEKCTYDKCVNLKVAQGDLMPLVRRSPHIKLDTFLSIKKLKYGDFKYNGFIELEVALDLPL